MATGNTFNPPPSAAPVMPVLPSTPVGSGFNAGIAGAPQNGGANSPPPTSSSSGLGNFLNSPGAAALINAAGGAATAYGNNQQSEAQRQQNASQFAATQLANQSQQDRTNAQAALTPLGESQNFVARNSLLDSILPNLRNFDYSSKSGHPTQGGFLPEGGLDKGMIDSLYGSTPTLESLAQRSKQLSAINPQAPQENFGNLGGYGDQKAQPFMDSTQKYQQIMQAAQGGQRDQINQLLQQGLDEENKSDNPSDGFWHKFAKWAGIAGAGVATVMTAGAASPLLAAAIGAGAGAASGWGSGGGAKGALLGAGLGAAGPAIGSAGLSPLKSAIIGTGVNSALNQAR